MAILRNITGLVPGIICGAVVNMTIITVGPPIVPPPPGVDNSDTESVGAYFPMAWLGVFVARRFVGKAVTGAGIVTGDA